jgi:crotonobetainyl-CoA:carnitine CoA-transferase CaiB-like acyl-CoA transferase
VAGILDGYRVLELGGYVAAPFCGLVLAQLGAEVIKVESFSGDPTRVRTANFIANNAGKRSVVIDLKRPEATAAWHPLLSSAHALVHNVDNAAMKRLGITFEECRKVNPTLVYSHIKAFGEGPYSARTATNPIVEALSGLMSITDNGGKPGRQASSFFDQMAGLFAAIGIMVDLLRPAESGYSEVGLFETGLFSTAPRLADYVVSRELAGEVWGTAPYDTFETLDKKWIFLGVINDTFWRAFCEVMELPDALADTSIATSAQRLARKHYVNSIAAEAISRRSRTELLAMLEGVGVPAAPVYDFADVLQDPQVRAPGKTYSTSFDGHSLLLPTLPLIGSLAPSAPTSASTPELGEDSVDVLESLGLLPEDVGVLISQGVVSGSMPAGGGKGA